MLLNLLPADLSILPRNQQHGAFSTKPSAELRTQAFAEKPGTVKTQQQCAEPSFYSSRLEPKSFAGGVSSETLETLRKNTALVFSTDTKQTQTSVGVLGTYQTTPNAHTNYSDSSLHSQALQRAFH